MHFVGRADRAESAGLKGQGPDLKFYKNFLKSNKKGNYHRLDS